MSKEKIIIKANDAGWIYDEFDSSDDNICFFMRDFISGLVLHFKSWNEAAKWANSI